MTNREAFNAYMRCQLENSIKSIEELSDWVFVAWDLKYKDARITKNIHSELNWFWCTYGGRQFGKGIDSVVKWLRSDFEGNFPEEVERWKKRDSAWADAITRDFGEMKDEDDA